uniref:Uncharacterized protein n=1 Tax=Arundo donax TaxID=35708 RepID=A0A0A8ZZP9_ARUDO
MRSPAKTSAAAALWWTAGVGEVGDEFVESPRCRAREGPTRG